MRKHRKAKTALREFSHSKQTFDMHDVKVIIDLENYVSELEEMLMVFVPKNLVENLLKEAMKL
jgi:hypothetical protein